MCSCFLVVRLKGNYFDVYVRFRVDFFIGIFYLPTFSFSQGAFWCLGEMQSETSTTTGALAPLFSFIELSVLGVPPNDFTNTMDTGPWLNLTKQLDISSKRTIQSMSRPAMRHKSR